MAGPHHRGSHPKRAAALRRAANLDPATRCMAPTCRYGNGTLAEHPPGSTWDAGHVNDGQINGPLRPEASCCNRSAGATLGNQRRAGRVTTRDWYGGVG